MKLNPWHRFLLSMAILAMTICAGMFFVARSVAAEGKSSWSILKAHTQANQTLVQIGEWCSGTIIDSEKGYVVTASHCVELTDVHIKRTDRILRPDTGHTFVVKVDYYKPITVTRYIFSDTGEETGRIQYTTKVLASTYPTDIAILENISEEKFTGEVRMSTDPVKYGDKIYTVGNPMMFIQSISEGYVTKPKHKMSFGNGEVETIVIDSYMNGGSSGGGLFNDNGDLIGITNWGLAGGPYLASPVINVIAVLRTLSGKTDKIASIQ